MPKSVLEPASDHVLVVDKDRTQTIDGITLPDNVRQQEMVFGVVVSVGPECKYAKPEEIVCYGPYAGKNVALDGIEFRILKEGQIEAWVRAVPNPEPPAAAPTIHVYSDHKCIWCDQPEPSAPEGI